MSILSRVGVMSLLLLSALWPTYLNLRHAYNNPRLVGLAEGTAWEMFYRAVRAFDVLGRDDLLPGLFFGAAPAVTLFGIPAIDPVVVPALLLRSPESLALIWPGLVTVALLALLFGRGFCSFLCPASLLFGFNLRLRELMEDRLPRLEEARRVLPASLRWGILVGGTVAAIVTGAWVWHLLLPYALVAAEVRGLVAGAGWSAATGVLVFVLLADLLVVPGEVCRALCPLGGLLGRCARVALVRVDVKAGASPCPTDCNNCHEACDLRLDPREGTVPDCTLCGRCIPTCPPARLGVGIRPLRRAALAAAAAVGVLLLPAGALAHHYKGLPHYGYFDNYPQTPTEEYIASNGPWEMHFTIYNFQGMQRQYVDAPDDVQLFLVVYDLRRQKPYGGMARIQITSDDEPVANWHQGAEQESVFFLHAEIPDPDDLTLTVSFADPEGAPVTLASPFRLPGEGGRNPLVWVAVGLVGLVVLMAVASKQKRPNRGKRRAT